MPAYFPNFVKIYTHKFLLTERRTDTSIPAKSLKSTAWLVQDSHVLKKDWPTYGLVIGYDSCTHRPTIV